MRVRMLSFVCRIATVLCDELITRSEESYRVCMFNCLWSREFKNEVAKARVGLLRHRKKNLERMSTEILMSYTAVWLKGHMKGTENISQYSQPTDHERPNRRVRCSWFNILRAYWENINMATAPLTLRFKISDEQITQRLLKFVTEVEYKRAHKLW
jgi:hypothetical protein